MLADQVRPELYSSTGSSLYSLFYSALEPNFLILVSYLSFNVFLATKLIKIATKHHTKQLIQPLHIPATFPDGRQATNGMEQEPEPLSDTKLSKSLINTSIWAFKHNARNAKILTAVMAVISLASTWYYMISYLVFSYNAYLARCHLTAFPLPPQPPPLFNWDDPSMTLVSLHLRLLRLSQWLRSLSLFKEAWMEVVNDKPAWWWSSEICIITVASWALFLRSESKRLKIAQVWAFMALGQLVAISFAFNLFQLAVVYRTETEDLVPPAALPRAPTPAVEIESSETPTGQHAVPSQTLSGPSQDPGLRGLEAASRKFHQITLSHESNKLEKLGNACARWIPENVAIVLFIIGGLYTVFIGPNTIGRVLVMHTFPFLITLYPHRPKRMKQIESRVRTDQSATHGDHGQVRVTSRFVRAPRDTSISIGNTKVYLAFAATSLLLRFQSTYDVLVQSSSSGKKAGTGISTPLWESVKLLFPRTFLRHPAVSSIGSDHLAVLFSVIVFILFDSGLWIWRHANHRPSAQVSSVGGESLRRKPHLRLDKKDRRNVESKATLIYALLLLSPLIGPSAAFSLYLAFRQTCIHDFEHARRTRRLALEGLGLIAEPEREGRTSTNPGLFLYSEEEVEGRILEDEEGERVLEIRSKVPYTRGGGTSLDRGRTTEETEHASTAVGETRSGGSQGSRHHTSGGGRKKHAGK